MTTKTQVAEREGTVSSRFMNAVVKEFTSGTGELALTNYQKRLAQNYFMAVDTALNAAEGRRKKNNPTPVIWANVNMEQLSRDVVATARIGLDPMMDNHINVIPYKNSSTNKYDIGFIEGYRGLELKATKYGLDVPDDVVVELVYSNDKFKPIKKSYNNKVETYEFDIVNAFDRGDVIGGFYYHLYHDNPEKNRLKIFSLADIEKRKPKYASAEFWGGEKDVWESGKKVGKETVEGWFEEMAWKTIYRAAYRDITIDSQKIDEDYLRLKQIESNYTASEVQNEIDEKANSEILDIEAEVVGDYDESRTEAEFTENNEAASTVEEPQESRETQGEPAATSGPGF